MKTKFIITAATLTAALVATYFMKKRQTGTHPAELVPVKKSHHMTDVFAHAKNHVDQL